MHRVLIIAPDVGLRIQEEVFQAASGHQPIILSGIVGRARALEHIASNRFDIVHFATHGQEHVLKLSDGILEEEMLEHAVRQAPSIKVLFLNSCRSAHSAVEVYNHSAVNYSIGWPGDVADEAAMLWAKLFYQALQLDENDVRRAADVANDAVVRSHGISPDDLPLVLNGRSVAAMKEIVRLQGELAGVKAEMTSKSVMRVPVWVVGLSLFTTGLLLLTLMLAVLLRL